MHLKTNPDEFFTTIVGNESAWKHINQSINHLEENDLIYH